jgi:hypothetical protein
MSTMDSLRDRAACCFDMAPDSQHAARTPDGRVRLEVAGAWTGSDQDRAELPALLARIKPSVTAWYPGGPAGAFATILRPAPSPTAPNTSSWPAPGPPRRASSSATSSAPTRVLHAGDEILDTHIRTATKTPPVTPGGGSAAKTAQGTSTPPARPQAPPSPPWRSPEPRRARIRLLNVS